MQIGSTGGGTNPYSAYLALQQRGGLASSQPGASSLGSLGQSLSPFARATTKLGVRFGLLSDALSALAPSLRLLSAPTTLPLTVNSPSSASTSSAAHAEPARLLGTTPIRRTGGGVSGGTAAKLMANPVTLNPNPTPALAASLTTGRVKLDATGTSPGTTASMTFNPVTLTVTGTAGATTAKLVGSSVSLDSSTAAAATGATLASRALTLDTSAATALTTASLLGNSVSLDSSGAQVGTTATMTSNAVVLDTSNAAPSTYATFTGTSVTLDVSGAQAATTATLTGGDLGLDTSTATALTTASLLGNSITLDTGGAQAATYATLTSSAVALDAGGTTDFGLITLDGITTSLGVFDNTGKSTQDAAQYLVDTLNANAANTVTASVGGAASDQIVLTSKTIGSAGNFTESTAAGAFNGFAVGANATGQDAIAGSTDFGTFTVDGNNTFIGAFDNTGKTAQDAAQFIVDRLNANGSLNVTASVGGAANDQVLLTSKTAGAAGSFTVGAAESTTGINGGASANATDLYAGTTGLGAVTIDGVTTNLGTLQNAGKTDQDIAQYVVETLNANASNTVTASLGGAGGTTLLLTAKSTGSAGSFSIGSSTSAHNGMTAGASATGIDATAGTTDFGSITINGVSTNLGTFDNNGKTAADAAQYLVDTLNANGANTVTASLGGAGNDQVVLTAKTIGAAGNFSVGAASSSFTGLTAGDSGTGTTGGQTNFGLITLNGVTTSLGSFDNTGKTAQDAAQYLVDTLNANAANTVTASVGGAANDQIVLTAKVAGTAGNFTETTAAGAFNGFAVSDTATGVDGTDGSTDFGTFTVDGNNTFIGAFDNTGRTAQDAAQFIVDRLNANGTLNVTASIGGAANDQVLLTSKTAGAAGSFTVGAAESFTGINGGTNVTATDFNAGTTDLGSVTINGVTTHFGVFDNSGKTNQDVTQYVVDTLNANTANGFTASLGGAGLDQVVLSNNATGSSSILAVGSSTSAFNGFLTGDAATGLDATAGTTDFGSITINGVSTNLGTFDNNGKTAADAAQYLVDTLNANGANTVTASLGGAGNDQVVLTAKTIGVDGSFVLDTVTSPYTGLTEGFTASGTGLGPGQTDFGLVTINGVTTSLGSFDNNGHTAADAAQYLADTLNANPENRVTASVGGTHHDQLVLTANAAGAAGSFTLAATSTDTNGLSEGTYVEGVDGVAGSTDLGSVTLNGFTTYFGVFDNTDKTAQDAAQYIADTLNASGDGSLTANVGGATHDQVVLTANTLGTQGNFFVDSTTSTFNGFTDGTGGVGQDAAVGSTNFGTVTINGIATNLGVFDNTDQTAADAALYLIDQLNANGANTVTASVGGAAHDQIVLTSKALGSAGNFNINASTSIFSGLLAGSGAFGSDGTTSLTDFGSITINGVTTRFGTIDTSKYSDLGAAGYLANRLNATNSEIVASVENGRLAIASRDTGRHASLRVDAVGSDTDGNASNNRPVGFTVGTSATGSETNGQTSDTSSAASTVNPAFVQELNQRTETFMAAANRYLDLLDANKDLSGLGAFREEFLTALGKYDGKAAKAGFQIRGNRLQIDESTLESALNADSSGALNQLSQVHNAVNTTLDLHQGTIDHLQQVSASIDSSFGAKGGIGALSQATVTFQKLSAKSNGLSALLSTVNRMGSSMAFQASRIAAQWGLARKR